MDNEAIGLVRDYKRVIAPRFSTEPKVYLYGSYSKGHPGPKATLTWPSSCPVSRVTGSTSLPTSGLTSTR